MNNRKYHRTIPKTDKLEPVSRHYVVKSGDNSMVFPTKVELYDFLERHNYEYDDVLVYNISKLANV